MGITLLPNVVNAVLTLPLIILLGDIKYSYLHDAVSKGRSSELMLHNHKAEFMVQN